MNRIFPRLAVDASEETLSGGVRRMKPRKSLISMIILHNSILFEGVEADPVGPKTTQ